MQPFQKVNHAAYANFLQSKYELYTGAISVRSRPYYLGLDPSSVCQLRCPTCATGVDNETHRQRTGATTFRHNRSMLHGDLFDAVLDELGDDYLQVSTSFSARSARWGWRNAKASMNVSLMAHAGDLEVAGFELR